MKTLASVEDAEKRMAICRECEFFFKPTANCKKCGCFMKIKTKLALKKCPIEKWVEVKPHETNKTIQEYWKRDGV